MSASVHVEPAAGARLPRPRGPVSRTVIEALAGGRPVPQIALAHGSLLHDADSQLALWVLHQLHYRGFEGVPDEREWDLSALRLRGLLERRLEHELREATRVQVPRPPVGTPVAEALLQMPGTVDSPPLAAYLQRHATREEALDFLSQRSVQQLQESDPQSFLLPRLQGSAKVALAELQYDEYGAGRPARLHQRLYAEALEAAGLSSEQSAHVDSVTAVSLALTNVTSLFALQRRLRGAAAGHLAVFEASSSVPSRRIAAGLERLGFPDAVAAYFHEHVEADAVHEQVAARDLCESLVSSEPALRDDVLFGGAACVVLDALSARDLMRRWGHRDESTVRAL